MKNVEVGCVVKSLDFPGRDDFYFVGKVTAVVDGIITAKTLSICEEGEFVEIVEGRDEFRTPVQGLGMLDNIQTDRVTVLASASEVEAISIGEEN